VHVSPLPATPAPSPTPAVEPLVIVPSPDGKHTLVQNLADPAHPVTLYSLSIEPDIVRFISATEIGYATNSLGVTTIWRMSLKDMKPVSVAKVQGGTRTFTWSPDGTTVAYMANPGLWLKVGAASPRALTLHLPNPSRGPNSREQRGIDFSPDGKYLLMVDTFAAAGPPESADRAHFQVRSVPDLKFVWVPPAVLKGAWSTQAVWSHLSDRLYYNDVQGFQPLAPGVQTWDPPSTVTALAPDVAWYSPSVSPDDRLVAYAVGIDEGAPHVEVRDLQSGSVRALPGILGAPFFLTNDVMIESHYVPNTQGIGAPYWPGPVFVLNLVTNEETPLPAGLRLMDIWPH
jgi:Tol biopolymer transport system component